ncbi:diguanylate cyclase [bacterium]|nr:diguanylate cyclase [bacterium]
MRHIGFARLWLGTLLLLMAAGLALIWTLAPEAVAVHLYRQVARVESQNYAHRLVAGFENGARSFLLGQISPEDSRTLQTIATSERIYRLDLIDQSGRVFWSSVPEVIGQTNTPSDLHMALQSGKSFFERIHANEAEVSGRPAAPAEADDTDAQLDREVNHEILPLTLNGRIVGAIERYQDVTAVNAAWIDTIRWTFAVIGGLAGIAALFGVWRIHQASKQRLATMQAHVQTENAYLAEQVRVGREVRLLGEFNEWLQSSQSLDELYAMAKRFIGDMLPDVAGSIYVYSSTRDVLDGGCSWNGGVLHAHILPEECWGLRRGRTYVHAEGALTFRCAHAHDDAARNSICIPFLAHGETVGMMYLCLDDDLRAEDAANQHRLAQMCAERISLAIANVRMRDELQQQATRDVLTGLYNRRYLMDRLDRHAAHEADTPFAIVSIDVDHFKTFNDVYGHEGGDEVLRALGDLLGATCAGCEFACRLGGEEFMLVLPQLSADAALERAEAVRLAVLQLSVRHDGKTLPPVSVSIGVAHYSGSGDSLADVLREADEALYAAKSTGRNHVVAAQGARAVRPALIAAARNQAPLAASYPAPPA